MAAVCKSTLNAPVSAAAPRSGSRRVTRLLQPSQLHEPVDLEQLARAHALDRHALEVAVDDANARQVDVAKHAAAQGGVFECDRSGPRHFSLGARRRTDIPELAAADLRGGELHVAEIDVVKLRAAEIDLAEARARHVRALEVRALQVPVHCLDLR